MRKIFAVLLTLAMVLGMSMTAFPSTATSIYAQQGKCRNHAALSTLKTIKQPL